jgi:short-subunit dehydrogenase
MREDDDVRKIAIRIGPSFLEKELTMPKQTFKGKAAIVTGASSGIGRAIALRLAGEGARVALAARSAGRLEELAVACRALGGEAFVIPTDVAEESQCRDLVRRAAEAFGGIDLLVNNAGFSQVARLEDLADLTIFKNVMRVNFEGTLNCTFHALGALKKSAGRILNISSLGGVLALPYNSSYIASKHAVNGFSESIRMELAPAGVSVTVICPYWVVSEFHEHYLDKNGRAKGSAGRAMYTGKMMTADRCAAIALEAARRRRRQVLLGPGRLGVWMRLIAPRLFEKITIESFLKPVAKRMSEPFE